MAEGMIEEPVSDTADQPKGALGRLARALGKSLSDGRAASWLEQFGDVALMALGFGLKEPRDIPKSRAGSDDPAKELKSPPGDERWVGWIEAARAIVEGDQPAAKSNFSLGQLGKLDLFRREPLDRMPKTGGDEGGLGAPQPSRTAKLKRWRKVSVGMSDPTAARERGRTSTVHLAPWFAMAAMAVATLLGRGRKKPAGETPRPMTPAELDALEPGRGRCATSPLSMPALGWKDIFWRTYREMGRNRLTALSGGITFYILLATFPAIAAFVSLYGLFSDIGTVERQFDHVSSLLPHDVVSLISSQMLRLAKQRHVTLSAAFVVSTLLSVWSANAGMKSLFDGLNITYNETEKRDYVRRSLVTYTATLLALGFVASIAAMLIAAPVFFHTLGLHQFGVWWGPIRWLTVYLISITAFCLLYRYGPSRRHAQWRWVVFGGVLAATVWLAVSLGFSWWVNNVAHFGVTYGSLGAMVAYMLWVWVTGMVVLVGAELNSEIEHQTAIDTTVGEIRPMGLRGAAVADSVGKAFTVSPREAVQISTSFMRRQVGYVANFLRQITRFAA
jgi:membrane protein